MYRPGLAGLINVFWVVAVALPCLSPAQKVTSEALPAPQATPIPLTEIIGRSEDLHRQMAARGVPRKAELLADQKLLQQKESVLRSRVSDTEDLLASNPILVDVRAEQRYWRSYPQIVSKRNAITEAVRETSERVAFLEQQEMTWEATRREIVLLPGVVTAISQTVKQALSDIRQSKKEALEQRGLALTLQNQASRLDRMAREELAKVDEAVSQFRDRLLSTDGHPLWEIALRRQEASRKLALTSALARSYSRNREFFQQEAPGVFAFVVLYMVMVWVVLRLRRKLLKFVTPTETISRALSLTERPASLALMVMLPFGNTLLSSAPINVMVFWLLLMLVPLVLVIRQIWGDLLKTQLYVISAFFLANNALDFLIARSTLKRNLAALLTASSALAFVWLARSQKAERQSGTNIAARRYLYYALYGISFASVLALLANVFGFVTLSQLVRQTVVWSGFVGTATIVTVYSISSLVSALIHATRLGSLAALRLHGSVIETWLWRVVGAAGLCFWLLVTLDQLGIREAAVALLRRVLTARLPVPTLNFSIGDLLVFGAILVVGYLVAAGMRLTLCDDFLPRFKLERGIPELISAAVYYLLLVLVFLMAVSAAGMNLDKFAIVTGAVGVGLGFGLQNVVNNFASGLILQFERPIHVGDTLDVGSVTGIVSRIGVRSSTIRTPQGAEVIIPNATLVSGQVTNWTLHHTYRRAEIPVRVAYGSDPARVKQLLLDQVERNPRVLKNPPADAVFKGFGESALEFELQFWADQSVLGTVRSELGIEIHSALREAGIEIPFPQREVHVRGMNIEDAAPAADGKEGSGKAIGHQSTGSA